MFWSESVSSCYFLFTLFSQKVLSSFILTQHEFVADDLRLLIEWFKHLTTLFLRLYVSFEVPVFIYLIVGEKPRHKVHSDNM